MSKEHPIEVLMNPVLADPSVSPNPSDDDAEADSLEGALEAIKCLSSENASVRFIVIRIEPGWHLVNGETQREEG